jgi:teichuronic acid biosynthesis glycosyltransferase TuaG
MTLPSAPDVDVIVPSYNPTKRLCDVINSIITQEYNGKISVFIIDDASRPEYLQHYETLPSNVTVIRLNHNNGGPAQPRNIGLDHSSAPIIAFCDNDDIWMPRHLICAVQALRSTGSHFYSASKVETVLGQQTGKLKLRRLGKKDFLFGNPIIMSSVVLYGDIARKQRFNTDQNFIAVEDYDYWIRLNERNGKWVKSSMHMVNYNTEDGRLSSDKGRMVLRSSRVIAQQFGIPIPLAAIFFLAGHFLRAVGLSPGTLIKILPD